MPSRQAVPFTRGTMNVNWPEIQGSPRPPKAGHKRLSESNRTVVGCVTIAAVFIWGSFFTWPAIVAAQRASLGVACVSNLRQLSQGMLQYSEDHDGYLPPAHAWLDLEPLQNPRNFGCPEAMRIDRGPGYAMLAALSSMRTSKATTPAAMPMIFDSNLKGRNPAGRLDSLPNPPRHGTPRPYGDQIPHNNVAYADGHVRGLPNPRP